MALNIVLQFVDGQDVVLNVSRPLEKRLQRRFTKDEMEMALMAAEDTLVEILKAGTKKQPKG